MKRHSENFSSLLLSLSSLSYSVCSKRSTSILFLVGMLVLHAIVLLPTTTGLVSICLPNRHTTLHQQQRHLHLHTFPNIINSNKNKYCLNYKNRNECQLLSQIKQCNNQQLHNTQSCWPLSLSSSNSDSDSDTTISTADNTTIVDPAILNELKEYLQKRKEFNADEAAKADLGKVIGGTKGNAVLEYISGSPNKESIVDTVSNPLDYNELTKYGYGHLVTPIMKAGGRIKMYQLLGLDVPPIITTKQPKRLPRTIIIDRNGTLDKTQYTGLKLIQSIDDTIQAEELRMKQQKIVQQQQQQQQQLTTIVSTDVEAETMSKKNPATTSNKWKSDWTVQDLDEWGQQQGKVQAWARAARDGEFVSDSNETFVFDFISIPILQKLYSIIGTICIVVAYGQSTYPFGTTLIQLSDTDINTIINIVQIPSVLFICSSIISSIICYQIAQSDTMKRNSILWFIKGIFGGPFTIYYLKELSTLQTNLQVQQQQQQQERERQEQDQITQ